jgi:DNA-directed RNA polymerase specialized sigma24 family protein
MTALATRTIQAKKPLTINKDQIADVDLVDSYDCFIRALARRFTDSNEEAEAAAREIIIDIWRYSKRADQTQSAESILIALIARRRLIRYLQ